MAEADTAAMQHPGWVTAYRLRWKRRRLLWRSFRSRHALRAIANRTGQIEPNAILAVATMRNEMVRLPHFLEYYRGLGVDHFLVVDNDSTDGTLDYLKDQSDVSVWHTSASYRASRFGLDWMTWLQMRYAHRHWCLMVDCDELLVYAHCERHSLHDLTGWLDAQGKSAFGALMLDLYPKDALGAQPDEQNANPLGIVRWFDSGPYRARRQSPLGNLWVQGGVRERVFFRDDPQRSPTLNKIPLIRWNRRYAYVNSCHSLLPRPMNFAYSGPGGTEPSGVLLHTKFLPDIVSRSVQEKSRAQHFHSPEQFNHYYDDIASGPVLWTEGSQRYRDWAQLEELGLLSSGGWSGNAKHNPNIKSP